MAKYIPKSAVLAEIDRLKDKLYYEPENFKDVGAKMALDSLKSSLDTLEVKEVDLEKELSEVWRDWANEYDISFVSYKKIAKHFFELGLLHSIDESIVRKIIDLYFEASKHYDEVIKQEKYRTGGSQLAIDILDGSKDMKELCVQYVLDKVTKE